MTVRRNVGEKSFSGWARWRHQAPPTCDPHRQTHAGRIHRASV